MSGPRPTTPTHERGKGPTMTTSEQTTTAHPQHDPADDSGGRLPHLWTRTLGDLTITYVPDAACPHDPHPGLPRLRRRGLDGPRSPHHGRGSPGHGMRRAARRASWEAPAPGRRLHGRISGEDPEHFQHGFDHVQALPDHLQRLGVDPATLETVAFTHLHDDHTGWARPDAVDDPRSLFPNARWIVGEGELQGLDPASGPRLARPSDRTTAVADGTEIAEGIHAWALPGHTTGHTAWILDTGDGRRIVAFGDAMHSPVQIQHPDWEVVLDHDRTQAEHSRRRLVEFMAQDDVFGFGVHFADQQLGTVDDTGHWRPWEDKKDNR